jgi:hypothetical protein
MPALARLGVAPPIPRDVVEIMRVAAAHPQACQAAAAATGERSSVLIEAARFYLQQVLFRPDADCYRVLGIGRSDSRTTARKHMRWLLQWLHPDCNNSWDAVYAERVLKAWHEVSGKIPEVSGRVPAAADHSRRNENMSRKGKVKRGDFAGVRLPWIPQPVARPRMLNAYRVLGLLVMPVLLIAVTVAVWLVFFVYGPEQTAAMSPLR